MVMMLAEGIAEFEFMLPANRQSLDNIERFKKREYAVDAGSVDCIAHGFSNFANALRFPIEQCYEYGFA